MNDPVKVTFVFTFNEADLATIEMFNEQHVPISIIVEMLDGAAKILATTLVAEARGDVEELDVRDYLIAMRDFDREKLRMYFKQNNP